MACLGQVLLCDHCEHKMEMPASSEVLRNGRRIYIDQSVNLN